MDRKTKVFLILLICTYAVFAQQRVSLDWKMHNVGKVRQFVCNLGTLWPTGYLLGDFTGLIYCEFPPNSHEEHIGEGGIWVGAIVGEDTLVSVTTSWHSSVEFFPSENLWDTVWVVGRGEVVDIPYWPGYMGLSDQDFVCRFGDYHILNIGSHQPLYIDVIQTSHAWSSYPLDEFIVYQYYVIPTEDSPDLKDVYIAYWLDGNVGYRGQGWNFALDDYSIYLKDEHMGIAMDESGHTDGDAYSPIGIKIFPPDGYDDDELRWSFNWIMNPTTGPPSRDPDRYLEMSAGKIMSDQKEAVGSQFFISFGPFDLRYGDTLHFKVGEVLGNGYDGMIENLKRLKWLVGNNFHVPSPPPPPPLKVTPMDKKVVLNWKPLEGEVNPETYTDPYRSDSIDTPFEGYRVYKSTVSINGPWTLLAEYDIAGNGFGNEYGIEYEYVDVGLLNNFDYYYTVVAFSKPDTVSGFPSQESSLTANAVRVVPGTEPPESVGKVAVVPNPYRGDIAYHQYNPPWEKPAGSRERWMEQDRRIQFINLPRDCTIKIYTLSGDLVYTINHKSETVGYEDWNLTSSVGQAISSGIYLFTVQDNSTNEIQVGKFVVVK